MKRSIVREQIFKLLFRAEFVDAAEMPEQMDLFFTSGDMVAADKDREYIIEKCGKVMDKTSEIDGMLADKVKGWTLGRIGKVELAILRLAVYEIRFDEDIPTGVAISEAVELAKKFGDENSGSFVNGVLAKFSDRPAKGAAAGTGEA